MLKKAIMEELPIRDQIFHRENTWIPNLSFDENHELIKEIKLIELSRSIVLNILHELILKYGQDLKNEQWALEPLADIITCLSLMQIGFTRYNQLEKSKHKELTLPVFRYSVYDNINKLLKESKTLISYIDEKNDDKINLINDMLAELNYKPNPIKLKESICEEFYNRGKYYLN